MSNNFIGEIQLYSFGYAPRGWAFCAGQLLPIQQNQALFSLLGTTFGGNGTTNFALPDLRSRVPLHWGNGPGLPSVALGERAGVESVTLAQSEMPAHIHTPVASSATPTVGDLNGKAWATGGITAYGNPPNSPMAPTALANAGGSQPHPNIQPSLALNFCIALQGIFPSRN
jgi:microcystin-dependent protein